MKNFYCLAFCIFNVYQFSNSLNFNYKTCLPLSERVNWTRNLYEGTDPIIIESTKRSTHKIVSYIIGLLLKERLGYNVNISQTSWDEATETINRLACDKRVCKNHRPQSHINMEVWMPPGFTSSTWVNQDLVIDCGPLGPSAKTGIFFYNYENSDPSPDDWRKIGENKNYAFLNQSQLSFSQLQIFGNCNDTTTELCKTKFSIDPDLPHKQARLINNIYKNWTVGNVISKELINFYFTWYPNEITIQNNLSRILFPDCFQLTPNSPINHCDDDAVYQLAKVIWIEIKTRAPLIYDLIDSIQLTQEDLIEFLIQVNLSSVNREEEYFKIACGWIKSHKALWEPLTIGWNNTKILTVIMLLRKSKHNISIEENEALEYAVTSLNNDVDYFGSFQYQIEIKYIYISCDENEMLQDYLESVNIVVNEYGNPIIGILSGLPTECMNEVYKITNAKKKVMISFRHEIFPILLRYKRSTILLKQMNLPYIFQTMPTKVMYYTLLLKLMNSTGWHNFNIITDSDDYKNNLANISVSKEKLYKVSTFNEREFTKYLQENKASTQFFMVDSNDENIFKILCAAGKLKLTLDNGFLWIINKYLMNKLIPESLIECIPYIHLISNNYFYLTPSNPSTIICNDFYSDSLYRAINFLGHAVSLAIRKEPSVNNIDPDILMNNINNIESNTYFCSKKLMKHTPTKMNQNSLLWESWYFYKIEGKNATALFDLVKKHEDGNNLYIRIRNLKSWILPKNISTEQCWASFLEKFLQIRCLHAHTLICIFISFIILVAVILIFVIVYLKKAKDNGNPMKKAFHDLVQDLLDIDIHSSRLILNHIIGRGAFGMVYGGEACNPKGVLEAVAVKTICENSDIIEKINFFTEAKVMRTLRHANIVELIGVCLENENNLVFLIMELMVEGDLRNYLLSRRSNAAIYYENSQEAIELRNKLNSFARDTAEGLHYMHTKFMVHRDIACRNCLISHDFKVKLGDFGLTRHLSPANSNGYYKSKGNINLPVRWMPPEGIQFGLFSIKSDIWSFGILLFEIVTFGVCPYQDFSTSRNLELMERIKRNQVSIMNYLPQSARNSVVHKLMLQCCSFNPKDRPESMEQIISVLKSENSCIRPYLTEDPPKFEGDKNLDSLSAALPGIVIGEDELPFASPSQMQLSSSQRYLSIINRAFGIKSSNIKEKTDFSNHILRPCQSSISISKNQLSLEGINSYKMKTSRNLFVGSIPTDLCDNIEINKKPRNSIRSFSNIFKISPKQSIMKFKILSPDL